MALANSCGIAVFRVLLSRYNLAILAVAEGRTDAGFDLSWFPDIDWIGRYPPPAVILRIYPNEGGEVDIVPRQQLNIQPSRF